MILVLLNEHDYPLGQVSLTGVPFETIDMGFANTESIRFPCTATGQPSRLVFGDDKGNLLQVINSTINLRYLHKGDIILFAKGNLIIEANRDFKAQPVLLTTPISKRLT